MKFQWNNNIANELNPLRNNSRRKELQTWLLCWLKLQRSHQETREARFNRRATAGIEEGIEAADVGVSGALLLHRRRAATEMVAVCVFISFPKSDFFFFNFHIYF